MKKKRLGRTDLMVTELCFGALPLGPLQADIPPEQAISLIKKALDSGVNFIDTAESYQTQPYVGEAIKKSQKEAVIATKSAAATYEDMEESLIRSLKELQSDVIDVYHLHAARTTEQVFAERAGAYECLLDAKKDGLIRAVGISTHSVKVVKTALKQAGIDVIYPLINKAGMGVLHGTGEEMEEAIKEASKAGKGIYGMKALCGGHLIDDLKGSIDYVKKLEGMDAVSLGMVNEEELAMNIKLFEDEEYVPEVNRKKKQLMVMGFCSGCGQCVDVCPNEAISLKGGKAEVNPSQCILCGYCSPGCPMFALRLI